MEEASTTLAGILFHILIIPLPYFCDAGPTQWQTFVIADMNCF